MTQVSAFLHRVIEAAHRRWVTLSRWSVSLTTKMFLLVLIAVMPALAIQSYNEYDLRKSREADIRNKTVQITKQFGAEMGEIREGARQYLQVISELPSVSSMDVQECGKLLATLNARTSYYSLLGVADKSGKVRCTSRPTALASIADLPFFKRAMAQPDLAVGNYWVDPVNGVKQIHFALQFSDDPGGPVSGVVFAGLDLDWLSEHLKERGLTPTQSILIADREGNIIHGCPIPSSWSARTCAVAMPPSWTATRKAGRNPKASMALIASSAMCRRRCHHGTFSSAPASRKRPPSPPSIMSRNVASC